MMDFSNYPNISAIAENLGGIKKSAFNKKLMAKAEQDWAQLTPEEMYRIEQEAAGARRVLSCYVMPTAILRMDMRILWVIPTRDIIWIYGHVTKNSMNFIPTDKEHDVRLVTRNGENYSLGSVRTMAFTKKTPSEDAIRQIQEVIHPDRPGIICGWSDEIASAVRNNFAHVVQTVDANSMNM